MKCCQPLTALILNHSQVPIKILRAYLLETMFDPLIPVVEHVEPFQFPLPRNFNPNFLFTAIVSNKKLPHHFLFS